MSTYAQRYYQDYYQKNKEKLDARSAKYHREHRDTHLATQIRRRAVLQTALYWFKETKGCIECRITDYRMLEFDHLPELGLPDRAVFNKLPGLPRIWAELQKCEVVCANHHSVRTFERRKKTKSAAAPQFHRANGQQ